MNIRRRHEYEVKKERQNVISNAPVLSGLSSSSGRAKLTVRKVSVSEVRGQRSEVRWMRENKEETLRARKRCWMGRKEGERDASRRRRDRQLSRKIQYESSFPAENTHRQGVHLWEQGGRIVQNQDPVRPGRFWNRSWTHHRTR